MDPPSDVFQTECPVFLLIIREPHPVICCGNSIYSSCILQLKDSNKHRPICKTESFSDANGQGEGFGTHVSVFVTFMKGMYDFILNWPFIGSFLSYY